MSSDRTFRAVIFDLDGTLYDSSGLHRRVALKGLSRLSLLRLLRERRARKSLSGRAFGSEAAFKKAFFKKVPPRWYLEEYLPGMADILRTHYQGREGLAALLQSLREAGVKSAVFSDYGFVREKLDALGIDPALFDGLYDAASLGGLKPCRESFIKVAEALGVRPQDALMVGDRSDTDGKGASDSGMQFIRLVRGGKSGPQGGSKELCWPELKEYITTEINR